MSVKQKDIVEALGLTKGAVSQLVKKGMPLTSIEDARLWRINRGTRHKIPPVSTPIPTEITKKTPKESKDKIKEEKKQQPSIEFDPSNEISPAEIASRQARNAAIWADWFISQGDLEHARAWSDCFAKLQKQANDARMLEIELAEKEKSIVDLDEVLSGLGNEIGEWKRLFDSLGDRLSGTLPPEYAAKVTEEIERVKSDIMPHAETVARNMFGGKE